MYLWKVDALGRALAEGKVTEAGKAGYYLAATLGGTVVISTFHLWHTASMPGHLTFANTVISSAITVAGIILSFKANGDGKDYVARNFCLSLPIFIRIMLLFMAISAVVGFAGSLAFGTDNMDAFIDSPASDIVIENAFLAAYFLHLWVAFRRMPPSSPAPA